ncbi:MAG: hypothetical protein NT031_19930, partial [Planctomycetota bacterium]|nr:hypothetical protein [Planctomycetota bacterium]
MLKGMWRAELAVGGAVRPGIVGVVSLTVLTLVSVASAVVPYASVRIPDPGNRLQGITALNEGGRVACWNRTGTGYIWDGTNVTLLPGSGVLRESWSLAINDSDVAVGGISLGGFNLGGYSKAAKWQGGVLTQLDLGTLNGNDSVAYAINNAGMIAGRSIIGGNFHMFTLSPGGAVTDIGVPPAGLVPWIEGMNESGQVIMMGGGEMDGYIWQNGIYTPLHDTDGTNFGAPYGINDAGVVVGMSAPHQRNAKAVVW